MPPLNLTISSEDIATILRDKDFFYDTYIKLTNDALTLYAAGGRRKFGLKLHGALAALDLYVLTIVCSLMIFTSL